MPSLPLRLRPYTEPLPVAAGWLASPDIKAWLREARRICEADENAAVKFYPLAASARDQSVSGALIIVTGEGLVLDKVFGPQVQRLGVAAPGVFVPVMS